MENGLTLNVKDDIAPLTTISQVPHRNLNCVASDAITLLRACTLCLADGAIERAYMRMLANDRLTLLPAFSISRADDTITTARVLNPTVSLKRLFLIFYIR
jgi:hypothetical protein